MVNFVIDDRVLRSYHLFHYGYSGLCCLALTNTTIFDHATAQAQLGCRSYLLFIGSSLPKLYDFGLTIGESLSLTG